MWTRLFLAFVVLPAPLLAQNDECAGAIPLIHGVSQAFDTTTATLSAPAWPCAGSGGPDLWYTLTPVAVGNFVRIETCGTGYDSALQVFSGDCAGLVSVACNDDACGFQSVVTFTAAFTSPYFVRVGGYAGGTGMGTILSTELTPTTISAVTNLTGTWIDISTTGTPLSLSDDGEVDIPTTVGNSILPAGNVRVGSNGGIRFATGGSSLGYTNAPIPATGAFASGRCLLPFWDDINTQSGASGQIYWEEVGGVLVVQWEAAGFYNSGSDTVTFQVQVFPSGPTLAQFLYEDVTSPRAGGGGSATIGFQSEDSGIITQAQFSFDAPGAVANGDVISIVSAGGGLGAPYCSASANSTGLTGSMSAFGSPVVADADLTLVASDLPPNSFGLFIVSRVQGFVPNPAGSEGHLCLGGSIGRYVGPGQIMSSFTARRIELSIDLTQVPQPNGFEPALPGETWNFQLWHRDMVQGAPTSNFTDGLEIAFQ